MAEHTSEHITGAEVLSQESRRRHQQFRIPVEWAEDVARRVEAGRSFREAVNGIFVANAELLVLERKQRAKKRKKKT